MIGYIEGDIKIVFPKSQQILLACGNLGFLVKIPAFEIQSLLRAGAPYRKRIELYTSMIVKETEISLYGFSYLEEKNMFELLLSAKGIGPSTALRIISEITVEQCEEAIKTQNTKVFTSVSGIGEVTAQNICSIKLKDVQ